MPFPLKQISAIAAFECVAMWYTKLYLNAYFVPVVHSARPLPALSMMCCPIKCKCCFQRDTRVESAQLCTKSDSRHVSLQDWVLEVKETCYNSLVQDESLAEGEAEGNRVWMCWHSQPQQCRLLHSIMHLCSLGVLSLL